MKSELRQKSVCDAAHSERWVPNRGQGVIPLASVFSLSVHRNGNFAEGYRLPTASPYPKARRDTNQALVESSQSESRFSEMRSSTKSGVSQATVGWLIPSSVRLRPGSHVAQLNDRSITS